MNTVRRWLSIVFVVLATLRASSASEFSSYMRYVPVDESSGKLETSISVFEAPGRPQVTLYAVVHIGDAAYYADLEKRFPKMDALLYEMIKDEETAPDAVTEDGRRSPISSLQLGMKNALDLEFQLEAIDYSAPNFRHADMDPESFMKAQEEKGESILGLMIRASVIDSARRSPADSIRDNLRLFAALANPQRSNALKLYLGEQMPELELTLAGFESPESGGSVLVNGRNAVAMEVLEEVAQEGAQRVGIFYGAAHMPDFERRLRALGYEATDREWITAWDMTED